MAAAHLVQPVCLYLSSVEYQLADAIFSSQGEAMITYEDPQAAKAAIDWFNGEFCNKHLS